MTRRILVVWVLWVVAIAAAVSACGGSPKPQSTGSNAPSRARGGMIMKDVAAKERQEYAFADDGVAAGYAASPPAAGLLAQNTGGGAGAQARPQTPSPVATDAHDSALLIYTAELGVAVFQVEQAMNAVDAIGRELGGYLSARGDQRIVVRIPRHKFDEALKRIELLGDVTHRNVNAQDVTDEFVDLEVRLKNAYAMRIRFSELLKSANAVKDALEIEKELARVTESIERMEGQLKLLRDKIAYSSITVTFAPLSAQTVPDAQMTLPFPWLRELGLGSLLSVH